MRLNIAITGSSIITASISADSVCTEDFEKLFTAYCCGMYFLAVSVLAVN